MNHKCLVCNKELDTYWDLIDSVHVSCDVDQFFSNTQNSSLVWLSWHRKDKISGLNEKDCEVIKIDFVNKKRVA